MSMLSDASHWHYLPCGCEWFLLLHTGPVLIPRVACHVKAAGSKERLECSSSDNFNIASLRTLDVQAQRVGAVHILRIKT